MPRRKNNRLKIIQAILKADEIHSQVDLKERLKKKGYDVSQSTLSRDLKELGYIRAPIGDGSYRIIKVDSGEERIDLLFKLGLVELIGIDNIIVIKTRIGNAQAIAGAIDRARIDGIIGTVAGDDTILSLTRNKSVASRVIKKLKRYIE